MVFSTPLCSCYYRIRHPSLWYFTVQLNIFQVTEFKGSADVQKAAAAAESKLDNYYSKSDAIIYVVGLSTSGLHLALYTTCFNSYDDSSFSSGS